MADSQPDRLLDTYELIELICDTLVARQASQRRSARRKAARHKFAYPPNAGGLPPGQETFCDACDDIIYIRQGVARWDPEEDDIRLFFICKDCDFRLEQQFLQENRLTAWMELDAFLTWIGKDRLAREEGRELSVDDLRGLHLAIEIYNNKKTRAKKEMEKREKHKA